MFPDGEDDHASPSLLLTGVCLSSLHPITVTDILHVVPTVGTGLVLVTRTGLLNTLMESVSFCCIKSSQVLIFYLTITNHDFIWL